MQIVVKSMQTEFAKSITERKLYVAPVDGVYRVVSPNSELRPLLFLSELELARTNISRNSMRMYGDSNSPGWGTPIEEIYKRYGFHDCDDYALETYEHKKTYPKSAVIVRIKY